MIFDPAREVFEASIPTYKDPKSMKRLAVVNDNSSHILNP